MVRAYFTNGDGYNVGLAAFVIDDRISEIDPDVIEKIMIISRFCKDVLKYDMTINNGNELSGELVMVSPYIHIFMDICDYIRWREEILIEEFGNQQNPILKIGLSSFVKSNISYINIKDKIRYIISDANIPEFIEKIAKYNKI